MEILLNSHYRTLNSYTASLFVPCVNEDSGDADVTIARDHTGQGASSRAPVCGRGRRLSRAEGFNRRTHPRAHNACGTSKGACLIRLETDVACRPALRRQRRVHPRGRCTVREKKPGAIAAPAFWFFSSFSSSSWPGMSRPSMNSGQGPLENGWPPQGRP